MKVAFMLARSIAKHNKGFTLGLIILFMILTSFVVMERFTTPSVFESINDYAEEYRVPDLWAVTEVLPTSVGKQLPDVPEIVAREYNLVMNARCRVNGKTVYTMNLTGMEEDGFRKYHLEAEKHTREDLPEIMISSYFANTNEISTGEIVELATPEGYREFFVSALVSCPENMFCSRNSTSWCDSSDFGYLYLARDVMDEYFSTAEYANLWSFSIADDCPDDREEELCGEIADVFGSSLISVERFSTSEIRVSLEDELKQAQAAIQFMPYLSYILGIFFTCLFIRQIMQGQKKNIGLLRALGFSGHQVLVVFVLYTLLTGIAGLMLGIGLGAYLIRFITSIYKNTYSLPYIHYSTDIPVLIVLLVVPLVIGVVSCLICSGTISKLNPAEAYGGIAPAQGPDLPVWLQKLRVNEMKKIAIVTSYRNRRRFIMSAVSIGASIVISLAGIALGIANDAAVPAAFGDENGNGGRFRYDALVRYSNAADFPERVRELGKDIVAEPLTVIETTLHCGDRSLDVQINGLCDDSTLIVPEDRNGNSLRPEDGIILEAIAADLLGVKAGDTIQCGDVSLRVNGIALEFVNSIQYVSLETAGRLGFDAPNEVAVRFARGMDPDEGCADISELTGFDYAVMRDHQLISVRNGWRGKNVGVWLVITLSFALGMVIVLNMVALSVAEKNRDYAILIALGTRIREFLGMAVTENMLRYLAALVPAIPLGCMLAAYSLRVFSRMKTSYPFIHVGRVCLIAALMSFAYLVAGVLFTLWKVKSVEPSSALNARE